MQVKVQGNYVHITIDPIYDPMRVDSELVVKLSINQAYRLRDHLSNALARALRETYQSDEDR